MADGTGKVDIGSDLERRAWVTEGLIQKSATSFWAPYKGTTMDSVITVKNEVGKRQGNTVVMDFDGNLSGKPTKGNTQAKGTGEQKKKFSDKLVIADYRYVVDNGTKFDGVNIGDLSINEHSDSRSKLGDLWLRSEDQAYFDIGQQSADFRIDLGTAFTFDGALDIEKVVKQGTGFSTSPTGISKRLPLKPFMLQNGEPVWLFVIDVAMKNLLMKTTGAQNMFSNADVRGNENRLIRGALGKIGNFLYVEAGDFFGETSGNILTNGYYNYDNTGVEMAGLRTFDSVNNAWSGEDGFDPASTLRSRGLILGAGAFQKGNGMMPDYKYEETDFGKFSESCLETWCATKATKLLAENKDYADGKVAGYSYGTIGVDVTVQA